MSKELSSELDSLVITAITADFYFNQGVVLLYHEMEYKAAAECFEEAIKLDDKNPLYHNQLGNAYYSLKDYEAAAECYKKAITLAPENPQYHGSLGSSYHTLKDYKNAAESFKKAIKLAPENPQYHGSLGSSYHTLKDYKNAAESFKKAITLDDKNPLYHNQLGNAYYALKDYKNAAESCKKAITLDDKTPPYHSNLGRSYHALEDYAAAAECFEEAIKLDEKTPLYHNNLGDSYYALKDYAAAAECFEEAIKLDEKTPLYHNNLGRSYNALKDYEAAAESFKKAIKLDDKTPQYHGNLGGSYHTLKDYKNAAESFKKAIKLDDKNPLYHNQLGNAYYALKDYEAAAECYKKAITLAPENPQYHGSLGSSYHTLKDYKNAAECYKKAITLDDKNPLYHNQLGNAYYSLKDYEAAAECYKKAITLAPENPQYHRSLGSSYHTLKDYKNAAESFKKAIKLAPENPQYHGSLGACKSLIKNGLSKKKAVDKLERQHEAEQKKAEADAQRQEREKAEAKKRAADKLAQQLAKEKAEAVKRASEEEKKNKAADKKAKKDAEKAEIQEIKAKFDEISEITKSAIAVLDKSSKLDSDYEKFITEVQESISRTISTFPKLTEDIKTQLKQYYILIGKAFYKLRQYDSAIESYYKAVDLCVQDEASLNNNIGLAQEALNLFDEAKGSYLAAIKASKQYESEYYKNYADMLTKSPSMDDQISAIFTYAFVLRDEASMDKSDISDIETKKAEAIEKIKTSGVSSCVITAPSENMLEDDVDIIKKFAVLVNDIGLLGLTFSNIKFSTHKILFGELLSIESNSNLLLVKDSSDKIYRNEVNCKKFIDETCSNLEKSVGCKYDFMDLMINVPYFVNMLKDLKIVISSKAFRGISDKIELDELDFAGTVQAMEDLKNKLIVVHLRSKSDSSNYKSILETKKYGFDIRDHILTIANFKQKTKEFVKSRVEVILEGCKLANISDRSVFEALARSNDTTLKNKIKSLCDDLYQIEISSFDIEMYIGLLDALKLQAMPNDDFISELTPEIETIKTIYEKVYANNGDNESVIVSTFEFYQNLVKKLSTESAREDLLQEMIDSLEGIYTQAHTKLSDQREGMIKILAKARDIKPKLHPSEGYEHDIQEMLKKFSAPGSKKGTSSGEEDSAITWHIGGNQNIVLDPKIGNTDIIHTGIPNCYASVTREAYDQLSHQFKQKLPEVLGKFTQKAHGQNGIKAIEGDVYEAKLASCDERLLCKNMILRSEKSGVTSTLIIFNECLDHKGISHELRARGAEEPGPSDYKIELANIVRSLKSSSTASLEEPSPSDCNIADVLGRAPESDSESTRSHSETSSCLGGGSDDDLQFLG